MLSQSPPSRINLGCIDPQSIINDDNDYEAIEQSTTRWRTLAH